MEVTFNIPIFYAVLAVIDEGLNESYNAWRQQHIDQGFSWRPGSVSFRTLRDVGNQSVTVRRADQTNPRPDAQRSILVPFTVSPPGRLANSDLMEDQFINMPGGSYSLLFETGYDVDSEIWCDLTFVPGAPATAQILRADAVLSPSYPLLMEAEPV
jgi:Competence protein J (ComJ)